MRNKPTEKSALLHRHDALGCDWFIEYLFGCSHNCSYCFSKKGYKKNTGWDIPVSIFRNHLKKAENELERTQINEGIFFSQAHDPFPIRMKNLHTISLELIHFFLENNRRCVIRTKGMIPDDFYSDVIFRDVRVETSISTLTSRWKLFEHCISPEKRLKELKKAHDNGNETGLAISPFFYQWNESIGKILEKAEFVQSIRFNGLNYFHCNNDLDFPDYAQKYYLNISDTIFEFCEKRKIRFFNGEGIRKIIDKTYSHTHTPKEY